LSTSYVIPRGEFHRLRKIDILEMNQGRGYRIDAHKVTESEVTFLTQIPGSSSWTSFTSTPESIHRARRAGETVRARAQ
jgi:hypothetical protein